MFLFLTGKMQTSRFPPFWSLLVWGLRGLFLNTEIDVMVAFQEVLMMLDNYVRDFKALIDWIQLQEKLEKADAQSR